MNPAQRVVLVVGAILVALVTVFPPWEDIQEHHFPTATYSTRAWVRTDASLRYNGSRHVCELIGISAAASMLVLALSKAKA